jgi:phospholipid N-methyltransferase
VNRVTLTIRHQWNDGGRIFNHNEPLDKIREVMSKAQVEEARQDGRLTETNNGIGFWLAESPKEPATPKAQTKPETTAFDAMRESLRAGVQIVTAPQLFPTPRALAERVAKIADVKPGHRVLEPSAGTGALLGAIGGRMFAHNPEAGAVSAVEINQSLADRLRQEFPLTHVICDDFLKCNGDLGAFDRIVMNPPFANADDIKHIKHALTMLKPGGRLVAICANGPRQREALSHLGTWEDLPPGSFATSGTNVNAALLVVQS